MSFYPFLHQSNLPFFHQLSIFHLYSSTPSPSPAFLLAFFPCSFTFSVDLTSHHYPLLSPTGFEKSVLEIFNQNQVSLATMNSMFNSFDAFCAKFLGQKLWFSVEMVEQQVREGRSLAETPTWAVATVVTFMVTLGFFFQTILKQFGKWLDKTKRKSLLAALAKIKDELMLFGLLSLLMGHWIVFVAKICVKSSALSSKFYPCELKGYSRSVQGISVSSSDYLNKTLVGEQLNTRQHQYCPEGRESFASYESLEQLHRFIFVLGVTHVSYSFVSIALGMMKVILLLESLYIAGEYGKIKLKPWPFRVSKVHQKRHQGVENWCDCLPLFFTTPPIHGASMEFWFGW
ncbi:hypothetical protein Patl1_29099 [Pistacia atlantica]|uniref:Uncharacterized protein n=1 Tax=Pistacia atlantica TaxID=434234 RepID=A0ACC1BEC9_9ROSI|nr:hypothetical protein Patl1_29099 [Pistacia atlantica]